MIHKCMRIFIFMHIFKKHGCFPAYALECNKPPRANVFLRRDNQTRLVLRWVKVIPLVAESRINATHREDWLPNARRNMQMSRPARATTKRGRERSLPILPLCVSRLSILLFPSLFRLSRNGPSWKRTCAPL